MSQYFNIGSVADERYYQDILESAKILEIGLELAKLFPLEHWRSGDDWRFGEIQGVRIEFLYSTGATSTPEEQTIRHCKANE